MGDIRCEPGLKLSAVQSDRQFCYVRCGSETDILVRIRHVLLTKTDILSVRVDVRYVLPKASVAAIIANDRHLKVNLSLELMADTQLL